MKTIVAAIAIFVSVLAFPQSARADEAQLGDERFDDVTEGGPERRISSEAVLAPTRSVALDQDGAGDGPPDLFGGPSLGRSNGTSSFHKDFTTPLNTTGLALEAAGFEFLGPAGSTVDFVLEPVGGAAGVVQPGGVTRRHESQVPYHAAKGVEKLKNITGVEPHRGEDFAGGFFADGDSRRNPYPELIRDSQGTTSTELAIPVEPSRETSPASQTPHVPVSPSVLQFEATASKPRGFETYLLLPVIAAVIAGAALINTRGPWWGMGFGRTTAWILQWPLVQRAVTLKANLLKNPVRLMIFELLRSEPGITITSISRRLSKGWGSTYYHVYLLEKNGLVKHVRCGYQKFYFRDEETETNCQTVSLLRKPRSRDILEVIHGHPGIRQMDILALAHTSRRVFREYLLHFQRLGLVIESRDTSDGRVCRYYPTPLAAAALRQPNPASSMRPPNATGHQQE